MPAQHWRSRENSRSSFRDFEVLSELASAQFSLAATCERYFNACNKNDTHAGKDSARRFIASGRPSPAVVRIRAGHRGGPVGASSPRQTAPFRLLGWPGRATTKVAPGKSRVAKRRPAPFTANRRNFFPPHRKLLEPVKFRWNVQLTDSTLPQFPKNARNPTLRERSAGARTQQEGDQDRMKNLSSFTSGTHHKHTRENL